VENECTGCGICADLCPSDAILMTREMALPEPVSGRCTGCMTCVEECPFEAIVVKPMGQLWLAGRARWRQGQVLDDGTAQEGE